MDLNLKYFQNKVTSSVTEEALVECILIEA
jgi:hypothetical protein